MLIDTNKRDHREVKGIAFRDGGRIVLSPPRSLIKDLDDLPFVSKVYKEFLPMEKYFFSLAQNPMVMLITGRGCPNKCFYCVYSQTLHGRKYRSRSPENVVQELELIQAEMPEIKEVVFEDDTFTADQKRVREICRLIIEREIKIDWFANIRVDIDFETLEAMKAAGFKRCAVGFESGSQEILDAMGKGTTLEQAQKFKKDCDKLGIMVHGCFMVGFPGETRETMQRTFEFAKSLNCDTAQFYPVFLYPGTEAYDWAKKHDYIKTEDYSQWLTSEGGHNCIYDIPGLSAGEMSSFCEWAYRSYYLSPAYLLKKLGQSFSNWQEAGRNVRSGIHFFRYLLSGGGK